MWLKAKGKKRKGYNGEGRKEVWGWGGRKNGPKGKKLERYKKELGERKGKQNVAMDKIPLPTWHPCPKFGPGHVRDSYSVLLWEIY